MKCRFNNLFAIRLKFNRIHGAVVNGSAKVASFTFVLLVLKTRATHLSEDFLRLGAVSRITECTFIRHIPRAFLAQPFRAINSVR